MLDYRVLSEATGINNLNKLQAWMQNAEEIAPNSKLIADAVNKFFKNGK